jgi:hypothetical protein
MSNTGNYNPLKTIKAKIADGKMVFKVGDNPWSEHIPGAGGHELIINPLEVPHIKVHYVLEFVPDSTE